MEAAIKRVEEKIDEEVENSPDPFVAEAVELLDTIPGIAETVAQIIVSEIGVDMSRFATEKHLSSWAGICPSNRESAGKRKEGRINKSNPYLKGALVQAAWAASHQKDTFLAGKYKRLVKRMGKKKALVAIAHSLLVIIYNILKQRESYKELGVDYLDKRNVENHRRRLIRQLEGLGLRVTVEEVGQAA